MSPAPRDSRIVFIDVAGVHGRHGAGGDPNLFGLRLIEKRSDVGLYSVGGRIEIVFEIAANVDAFPRGASIHVAPGVFFGLYEDRIGPLQDNFKEPTPPLVFFRGAIRDAAVGNHQ